MQDGRRDSNNARRVATVLGIVLLAACGSSRSATPKAPTETLQAAARSYAESYLHGSLRELLATTGSECQVKHKVGTLKNANAQLRGFRAQLARQLGPLSAIKIVGVRVRNVSAKAGDAEVRYNLSSDVAGTDNWVHYRVEGGAWREADCISPIGGSSSSSGTVFAPPPSDGSATSVPLAREQTALTATSTPRELPARTTHPSAQNLARLTATRTSSARSTRAAP